MYFRCLVSKTTRIIGRVIWYQVYTPEVNFSKTEAYISFNSKFRVTKYSFGFQILGFGFGINWNKKLENKEKSE